MSVGILVRSGIWSGWCGCMVETGGSGYSWNSSSCWAELRIRKLILNPMLVVATCHMNQSSGSQAAVAYISVGIEFVTLICGGAWWPTEWCAYVWTPTTFVCAWIKSKVKPHIIWVCNTYFSFGDFMHTRFSRWMYRKNPLSLDNLLGGSFNQIRATLKSQYQLYWIIAIHSGLLTKFLITHAS